MDELRIRKEGFIKYLNYHGKELKDIDFNKEIKGKTDILVLAHQPGIGKTYKVLRYIEENPNSIYFTDRHATISEAKKTFKEDLTHWMGFKYQCHYKGFIKKYNNHVPANILCERCHRNKSECDYWKQFEGNLPIFTVFEYLYHDKFKEWINKKGKNRPKIVFLDECKLGINTFKFNKEEVHHWLLTLGVGHNIADAALNPKENHQTLTNNIKKITHRYFDTINEAENNRDNKLLTKATKYNPIEISEYLKWANIYNNFDREIYGLPYWYYAFDLVSKGILPVFLDATFNVLWFHYMLQCYHGEIGFRKKPINLSIYGSRKDNFNTVVYSMRQSKSQFGGWYPKKSFIEKYKNIKEWLTEDMKNIMDIFGAENVGVIGFKDFLDIPRTVGIKALSYGDLRSSNALEDVRVVVILGTFYGTKEQIHEQIYQLFYFDDMDNIMEKTEEEDDFRTVYVTEGYGPESHSILMEKQRRYFYDKYPIDDIGELEIGERGDYYTVKPVQWIQDAIWNNEIYQAIHRNRGLRKDRTIFVYGWFAPNINNEFTIIPVQRKPKEKEQELWDYLRKTQKGGVMHKIIKDIEAGAKSKDIAKKYRVSKAYSKDGKKKTGQDTKTVTQFIKSYKKLKEKVNYPEE